MILALSLSACGGSSSGSGRSSSGSGSVSGGSDNGSGGIDNAPEPSGGQNNLGFEFSAPTGNQIRPGVTVSADGAQCTSNFLYALNDQTVYLGVAAHCFSFDSNSGIDPCESRNLPIGFDQVVVENASRPATLVYSSWVAMQQEGETPGSAACVYNDFALVRLHPDDVANIHPAVRSLGGPTSLARGTAAVGDAVVLYGRAPATLDLEPLQVREGEIVEVLGGGWSYDVTLDGVVAPGDSGGPVLTGDGRALALINVLALNISADSLLSPLRGGVSNLDRSLEYAKANGFIQRGVTLLTWSEFTTPLL